MALDCSAVLIAHLLENTAIAAAVGTSVYGKCLPDGVGPPAIIVDMTGDSTNNNYPEILIKHFEFACFGNRTTANQEFTVHGALLDYMRAPAQTTTGGGYVRVCIQDEGSSESEMIDENTGYPYTVSKWVVHFIASA